MANVSDIRIDISLPNHRKFKRLKRIFGLNAMEYLVRLWTETALQCPDGYLKGWDVIDIADCVGWDKKPNELVKVLVDEKWLDKVNGGYYIHDWHEHQPWVVRAPQRKQKAENAAKVRWENPQENKGLSATSIQQAMPVAMPLSLPTLTKPKPRGEKAYSESFNKFWDMYPRKQKKSNAYKSWLKIDSSLHDEIYKSVEAFKSSQEWEKNNGEFIPHPTTWINQKRWEDEIEADKKQEMNWVK